MPSCSENGHRLPTLPPDALREAERHVRSCADCSSKVSRYRQLLNMASIVAISDGVRSAAGCPKDEDIDWHEVATGQWPELKAKQLIMHAALCSHCGPLLRAATSADDHPTAEEEKMLAELAAPTQPLTQARREPLPQAGPPSAGRRFLSWNVLVPVAGLTLLLAVLIGLPRLSEPVSGPKYAQFAVATHRLHLEGKLPLEVHSASQQTINEWFMANSRFPLVLPASPAAVGEARPFRLEGARIVKVGEKPAAFIAYDVWTPKLQMTAASLIVTRDSVAVASGGVQVNFNKVSFHYATVQGYRVVTWSLHGLTYALVSEETNSTQGSCMVCHSAMRDRNLTHTPTPLHTGQDPPGSALE